MIIKVRCVECHGPLDLSKPFDESEWTEVRIKKLEDLRGPDDWRLKCHVDHKGGEPEQVHSDSADGPLPGPEA